MMKKGSRRKSSQKSSKRKPASPRFISRRRSSRTPRSSFSKTPQLVLTPAQSTLAVEDLPFSYNETKLVLMVRDPFWAYAYWDFSAQTWEWIQNFKQRHKNFRAVIRIYHLEQKSDWDIETDLEAKRLYLDLKFPNNTFEAELGLIDSAGKFCGIVKSPPRVRTPRNAPSEKIDLEWMPVEMGSDFEENPLYSGSGLFSPSKKS